jgi:hypothetical protein
MPEPVVGDLLSDGRARGLGLWLLHHAMVTVVLRRESGVRVMWCGSRARGSDRLLKLALDPADEACR